MGGGYYFPFVVQKESHLIPEETKVKETETLSEIVRKYVKEIYSFTNNTAIPRFEGLSSNANTFGERIESMYRYPVPVSFSALQRAKRSPQEILRDLVEPVRFFFSLS